MPKKIHQLVGTSYVARVLGVSEVRVRQLVEAGQLKAAHKTFDGRRFYNPLEVERLRLLRQKRKASEFQEEVRP